MINVVWWRLAWSLIRKLNWLKKNLEEETGLLIPFGENQESGDKELIFVFLLFLKEVKNQKTGNWPKWHLLFWSWRADSLSTWSQRQLKTEKKHCLSFFVSKYHSISFLLSYMEEEIFLFYSQNGLLYVYLVMFCICI